MNLPLSVITWRIGKIPIEELENLVLSEQNKQKILRQLKSEFNSVFYLATCQRIILATSITSPNRVNDLLQRYILLTTGDNHKNKQVEVFTGQDALLHLSIIISSLDSIVLGEDQIQYQFKQAFTINTPYMDKSLKSMLQHVIRTGKRVRRDTFLKNGKTSTINLIASQYSSIIKNARSIGVLGTGKMGVGVIKEISKITPNITIYSRKKDRIGLNLHGIKVEDFTNFKHHDILITATTVYMPLITKDVIESLGGQSLHIFDLGIPRNCSVEIKDLPNINLIGINDLLNLSREVHSKTDMRGVHEVLKKEISNVVSKFKSTLYSNQIRSLRADLNKITEEAQPHFLVDDPKARKEFKQFINQLIHVSQQHLEDALIN